MLQIVDETLKMLAAYNPFDNSIGYADFQKSDMPVWLLGEKFNLLNDSDLETIREVIQSRLFFTYRKNFLPIGDSTYTSDSGWGCMHRCGQMLVGEAFIRRHLGRDWLWEPGSLNATYLKILKKFNDVEECLYSIHRIAINGSILQKEVGEWFGPNTVSQVMKKLTREDEENDVVIYVALDRMVIRQEIKKSCIENVADCSSNEVKDHSSVVHKSIARESNQESDSFTLQSQSEVQKSNWKPLVLVVPLRIGQNHIEPSDLERLKEFFKCPESLGIIGGRTNHASYFIGFTGDKLIYLDPHISQVHSSDIESIDETYHCQHPGQMPFQYLDPSLAVCFYIDSEECFDNFCEKITLMFDRFFEVLEEPLDLDKLKLMAYLGGVEDESETERQFTSDNEFEIL